jgi:TetR/AcrR family transcriptional regulator, transcriptional repressor for nem operon
VRELLAANFDAWVGAVERCLDEGAQQLPPGVNRRELAHFVLTVMEGAVMQARTYRSLDVYDACVRRLRHYFDQLRSGAASTAS